MFINQKGANFCGVCKSHFRTNLSFRHARLLRHCWATAIAASFFFHQNLCKTLILLMLPLTVALLGHKSICKFQKRISKIDIGPEILIYKFFLQSASAFKFLCNNGQYFLKKNLIDFTMKSWPIMIQQLFYVELNYLYLCLDLMLH